MVVRIEVPNMPLPVVVRHQRSAVLLAHSGLIIGMLLLLLFEQEMLAILLLHELCVLSFLIFALHPGQINTALYIDLIGSESLVVRHDQVYVICFLDIHMYLIMLLASVHRPSYQGSQSCKPNKSALSSKHHYFLCL